MGVVARDRRLDHGHQGRPRRRRRRGPGDRYVRIPVSTPRPLWSEQDPALWWDGAIDAIRQVLAAAGIEPAAVEAVGLTGQMHGLVVLDADGRGPPTRDPVERPAHRRRVRRRSAPRSGRERLVEITGNDALTGFTAPKLVWVRDHEPEVWRRIAHVLLPKDYVRLRLTGEHAMDKADGVGHHPVRPRGPRLVARGDGRRWASTRPGCRATFEGPEVTGRITPAAAAATRAREPARRSWRAAATRPPTRSAWGRWCPGRVALSLGTSGVVFATTDRPLYEPAGGSTPSAMRCPAGGT